MKKTAIVTGGSRGIGYAIVRALGLAGCNVVIMATREQSAYTEALNRLSDEGIRWHYVRGSIDVKADRQKLIDETLRVFGRVDILVNNAGVAPKQRGDLLDMTEESFERVIGINTEGTFFLTQLIARQMIAQGKADKQDKQQDAQRPPKNGTIINIGSCSAEVVSAQRGEYCISKAGVSMITKLFAERLAEENILVHEVRPGVIATDMTSAVKDKYDTMLRDGVFPIRRWGQPEDVAEMVALLCSESVLYTTGNYIDVDGGFHIKRL